MAWMMDEYSKLRGKNQFGIVTGKPLELGGSAGRSDATARGGLYALREAAKVRGIDLSKATLAVQGYGNAGYHVARLAGELFGSRVVAISDSSGAIYNQEGLHVQQIYEHKSRTGSVVGFGTEKISQEDLLQLEVDVLCPAAIENTIHQKNAGSIKASIIAEFSMVGSRMPMIYFAAMMFMLSLISSAMQGVTVPILKWFKIFPCFTGKKRKCINSWIKKCRQPIMRCCKLLKTIKSTCGKLLM